MNTNGANREFVSALRASLLEEVARTTQPNRKSRRIVAGVGIGLAAALTGGGVAVATGLLPLPGGNDVTAVSGSASGTFTGPGSLELGAAPADANAVEIEFTCITAGEFKFASPEVKPDQPSDPKQVSSVVCATPADGNALTGVIELRDLDGTRLTVQASAGSEWSVSARYVDKEVTGWATNANGSTYGVHNANGDPDLIQVSASNGKPGYAYVIDLTGGSVPGSPESLDTSANGVDKHVPVYESDGVTVIGEITINGSTKIEIEGLDENGVAQSITETG